MFYLRNSGKSCLFRSLVGFLKNTNRQKRRFTAPLSHYTPFVGYVPTEDEKTAQK